MYNNASANEELRCILTREKPKQSQETPRPFLMKRKGGGGWLSIQERREKRKQKRRARKTKLHASQPTRDAPSLFFFLLDST